MITIADLIRILTLQHKLIHDQTNGLSQADTLIQPRPGGNCMNWVLGHMLDNQIEVMEVLGGQSPVDAKMVERYQRESQPVLGDEPGLLTLDRLLECHDRMFEAITARLSEMQDEDFDVEIHLGERHFKRGWRVFFLHFHYTYHIGQLEMLRQLTGRTEKII